MIVFAESSGRTTLLLLEDTVEVADIVETTVVTDVCHTVGGIYQLPGSMAQTYVDDVVGYRLAGLHTEVAAESSRRHTGYGVFFTLEKLRLASRV